MYKDLPTKHFLSPENVCLSWEVYPSIIGFWDEIILDIGWQWELFISGVKWCFPSESLILILKKTQIENLANECTYFIAETQYI